MRIAVVGGGPAGLYFAILMNEGVAAAARRHRVRAQPGPTTRSDSASCSPTRLWRPSRPMTDEASYRRHHCDHFAYWDDIAIHFKRHRAPHRWQRLLRLLAPHAAADFAGAGARTRRRCLRFERPSRPTSIREADHCAMPTCVVAATASTAAPARCSRSTSSPRSTCGPTTSSGWARPGRSTPSPSIFQARRAWRLHRPLLPVRGRPLDLDLRDRSGDVPSAGLGLKDERAAIGRRTWRRSSLRN